MFYFVASDEWYFSKEGNAFVCDTYKVKELIFVDSPETVIAFLQTPQKHQAFIAPWRPEELAPFFATTHIFEVVNLPNRAGLATLAQKERGIDPKTILRERLDVRISKPSLTLAHYGSDGEGANILFAEARKIPLKKLLHIPVKGFFLTGIPGTGKTFFAQCLSGELNRFLVELNLSKFMESSDTIGLLDQFFLFFEENEGEYILLIDEIEKMLGGSEKSKQVLGYLLTKINDFSKYGAKSDIFFIATANNITNLATENPEFFRRGRFDLVIYLGAPTELKAKNIFELYIKQKRVHFRDYFLPGLFYLAFFDNGEKLSFIQENSRAHKIITAFQENREKFSFVVQSCIEKKCNLSTTRELFLSSQQTSVALKNFVKDIEIEYFFNPDVTTICHDAFIQYRERLSNRDLFPYVPAEIAAFVDDAYIDWYFLTRGFDHRYMLETNKPLQISMKEGIDKMNGVTQDFLKV